MMFFLFHAVWVSLVLYQKFACSSVPNPVPENSLLDSTRYFGGKLVFCFKSRLKLLGGAKRRLLLKRHQQGAAKHSEPQQLPAKADGGDDDNDSLNFLTISRMNTA